VQGREKLSGAAEDFLNTAVKVAPIRLTWGQLGVLCQRKALGGSFNNARRQLLDYEYVNEIKSSLVNVLPAGFEYLRVAEPQKSVSTASLIETLMIAKAKSPVPLEHLGAALGRATRGGSWNTAMAILRNNDLIEETSRGFALAAIERQ
jgi:hypothetical protein